jgi:hypothetical protein
MPNATVQPLSSSPEPAKPQLEPIPIGLPVTSSSIDIHVKSAVPETVRSPALADATAARDPHNAETPSFVNLFIIYLLIVILLFI